VTKYLQLNIKAIPVYLFGETLQLEGLRIRRVDYSKGYLADHWCEKENKTVSRKDIFYNTL
jgi:hypothetical protein